jgi:hypothetical protein
MGVCCACVMFWVDLAQAFIYPEEGPTVVLYPAICACLLLLFPQPKRVAKEEKTVHLIPSASTTSVRRWLTRRPSFHRVTHGLSPPLLWRIWRPLCRRFALFSLRRAAACVDGPRERGRPDSAARVRGQFHPLPCAGVWDAGEPLHTGAPAPLRGGAA